MSDAHDGVQLLAELEAALTQRGCRVKMEAATLCINRPDWDEHSRQTFAMASAISSVTREETAFRAVVQELRDEGGHLHKYSITLLDGANQSVHAWHLDTKRGQHQHAYTKGIKQPDHITHDGSIEQIADAMIQMMDAY